MVLYLHRKIGVGGNNSSINQIIEGSKYEWFMFSLLVSFHFIDFDEKDY